MVHHQPIERRVEVLLDLPHQLARKRLELPERDAILGGNDEPELVPVLQTALNEGPGVGAVVLVLAVGGDALALQVTQVGGDGLTLDALQPHNARLDDDAPGPVAHAAAGPRLAGRGLPAAVAFEGSCRLTSPAACIEAAGRLRSPADRKTRRGSPPCSATARRTSATNVRGRFRG
jgi:hypothetical protein